jgi:hypothetical protein
MKKSRSSEEQIVVCLKQIEFAAAWGPRHAGSPMQVAEV